MSEKFPEFPMTLLAARTASFHNATTSRQQNSFPLHSQITNNLYISHGFDSHIDQGIDNKKEVIRCSDSRNVNVCELPDKMPVSMPRFNLYRYSHVKEGKYTEFVPGNASYCTLVIHYNPVYFKGAENLTFIEIRTYYTKRQYYGWN